MGSLGKTLLAFDLLHFVLQAQLCYYSRYLLTSYFCIPVPYNENDTFLGVLVLEGLVDQLEQGEMNLKKGKSICSCMACVCINVCFIIFSKEKPVWW